MVTLANFENIVPYKIMMRGEAYYESGAVSELEEVLPGDWEAAVDGTDSYNVGISMEGDEVKTWYCDCPYDGGICKHVVATLLAIRDNSKKAKRSTFSQMRIEVEQVVEEDEDTKAEILEQSRKASEYCNTDADLKKFLSLIKPNELLQFVFEYASANKEFKTALLQRITIKELYSASKEKDYKKEIQKVFEGSGLSRRSRYYNRYDDFSLDWDGIFNQVDALLEKTELFLTMGTLDPAISIALQILRSIGENYNDELVYNDDIDTCAYCEQAGELLMKVVQHPQITQKQISVISQELYEIAKLSPYWDYDVYDVDELMMQIEISTQPIDKALELIDKLIEDRKDSYDLYQLILRKIDLLTEHNESEKVEATIHQYLHLAPIRKMMVEKMIAREQYDEAIRVVDEGIKIAEEERYLGTIYEWIRLKLKIYEMANRTSEVIDICKQLFKSGQGVIEHYHKLKALIPEKQWKPILSGLMEEVNFSESPTFSVNDKARIYLEEKDHERLFHLLASKKYNQMEVLMEYAHHLNDTHSEQLLAIYTSFLVDYAERNLGRDHYEYIARVLKCMQKLNGGKVAVRYLVSEFRTKYKRRPAMMEILGKF